MPDPDLEIEGGKGGGGGGLQKLFPTLPPQFGLKIRAQAPSLDPPLV